MSYPVSVEELNKNDLSRIENDLIFKFTDEHAPVINEYGQATGVYGVDYSHELFDYDRKNKLVWIPIRYPLENANHSYMKHNFDYDTISDERKVCNILPFSSETDISGRKRDQDKMIDEAVHILVEKKSVLLSLFTGYGKTFCSAFISLKLGYKVCVLCHNDKLKEQFHNTFKMLNENIKIQYVKGKKDFDEDCDVYIIGIIKASKMDRTQIIEASIGTVIIDEVQMVTATAFSKTLLKFAPLYLIGLSATPDRKDGKHNLFVPYFGEKKDYIYRFEKKQFTVVEYRTKITPIINLKFIRGEMRADGVVKRNSIEDNEDRRKLICDIILKESDKKILVLCLYKIQIIKLEKMLKDKDVSVDTYFGNKKKYNTNARVLIAGIRKAGVGFDDPSLNMGIIASYTNDIRQLEGRIRCTDNIIYHIVDDHQSFRTMWNKCKKWYISRGAKIIIKGSHNSKSKKGGNEVKYIS